MKKEFLEAGKIVNTHGVRGEVKIMPWADSPDFLLGFKKFYINDEPIKVKSARVHKNAVIASLDGITDVDAAAALKNKIIFISRKDAKLEKGQFFIQDIIGLPAIDDITGEEIGAVKEVLDMPAQSIYVIVRNGKEILVPDVPEFITEVSADKGYVKIHLIEGME